MAYKLWIDGRWADSNGGQMMAIENPANNQKIDEVVDASREALQAERANAQLAGQRLIAAVQLIKALGGGWTEQQVYANASSRNSQPRTQNGQ